MLEYIVEDFRKKGKLFKKFEEVFPKELGIRNRITIYKTLDLKGYFWAIFVIKQKSRVLLKDVAKIEEIYKKLVAYKEHNFKYKTLYIDAPLCSKAKKGFKEAGWNVKEHTFM